MHGDNIFEKAIAKLKIHIELLLQMLLSKERHHLHFIRSKNQSLQIGILIFILYKQFLKALMVLRNINQKWRKYSVYKLKLPCSRKFLESCLPDSFIKNCSDNFI